MRIYLVWFLLLILTACATTTPVDNTPRKSSPTWEQQASSRASINHWDLKGLIAVRTQKDAVSATWQWREESNRHYSIHLFGPLGSNSFQLTGDPAQVLLQTSDGKQFNAPSPEILLEQQVGWRLPVSSLYYWIRGLPVPTLSAKKQFNANNQLALLAQDGWIIQYLDYNTVNQLDMPSKIVLTHPDITIKIVIKQWQI